MVVVSKWLKNILAFVILAFLVWYLAGHWGQLKALLKLSPAELVAIYCLWFLVSLSIARVVQGLLSALKTRTGFWDMVLLHNAAVLLNYAPMKFGTLFRANYLNVTIVLAILNSRPFFCISHF